jgi:nucleoside-diphosphate-sugar epimerase
MVKIAVAGGSQGLGSALVQALESHGSHEVRILSRKALDGDSRYLAVDYSSIEDLQTVLESNNIHTVISALSMENGGGQSQMNLIEAAERSKSTRRFMPSEFGVVYKEK